MKAKRILMPFVLMAVLMMMVGVVSATWATTHDTPIAGGTLTGDYTVGITTNVTDPTGVLFYAYCSDTANTSYVSINSSTANITSAQTVFNSTWTTTRFEDSSSCYLKAGVTNATGEYNSTAIAVVFDNTQPTMPTSQAPTSETAYKDGDDVIFNVTVTGAQTTGCTLYWRGSSPSTAMSHAMTHTANTCTVTVSDLSDGSWNWYVTATDGSDINSTGDASLTIDAEGLSSGGKLLVQQLSKEEQSKASSKNVLIVLIAVVALVVLSKNGKVSKKRR